MRRVYRRLSQIHQPEASGSNHIACGYEGQGRTSFSPAMLGEILSIPSGAIRPFIFEIAARAPCGEPVKPEEPRSRRHLFLNCRAAGVNRGSYPESLAFRRFGAPWWVIKQKGLNNPDHYDRSDWRVQSSCTIVELTMRRPCGHPSSGAAISAEFDMG